MNLLLFEGLEENLRDSIGLLGSIRKRYWLPDFKFFFLLLILSLIFGLNLGSIDSYCSEGLR